MKATNRKLKEEELHQVEARYQAAFRCSPDPITISTLQEGRYIEVNDSFVQLSGYQPSEVIGRTAFELNLWVNASDRTNLLQQLQNQGSIRNQEIRFRKKSGELILVQVAAEVIELDGIPCLLAISRDITERKQTEELLHLSAQRDRLLAKTLMRIRQSLNLDEILQNTVTEVRQFLQADRVFIALNDSRDLFKMIAESVDPQYPSVLSWKKKDQTILQELRTKFLTQQVRVVEDITQIAVSPQLAALYEQFQTKASLAVPIMLGKELFGALIANSCAKPRHWQEIEINLLQQLSQQLAIAIQQAQLYQKLAQLNNNLERQVEERTAQLQQKMQEVQEINRVKDVLLHAVSHDLRTTVMGNLMVLKNLLKTQKLAINEEDAGTRGCSDAGNMNKTISVSPCLSFCASSSSISIPSSIIDRMIQGNDRQLRMIDSLLEIHLTEVEGITLNQEIIKFNTFIREVTKNIEPMLRQNQSQLKTLVARNLPLVAADPVKLHKIFVNLFTYIIQSNPPGLDLQLTAKAEADMIRCSIKFNGTQMSKQECDRLFELYVQDPQARFSTGIGLKMYLSRQIIKAHGGEIGVESHRQRGVVFWFTLPMTNLTT